MADLTVEEAGALAPLVTPAQAAAIVEAGGVLIDVRSETGRRTAGVLPGAAVVAKDEVDSRFDLGSPDAVPGVTSKSTPVVIACGSVRGSGPVAAQLIADGFTNVVHVDGGFPAWRSAGLPTGAAAQA